jgi:hypothetical protein
LVQRHGKQKGKNGHDEKEERKQERLKLTSLESHSY